MYSEQERQLIRLRNLGVISEETFKDAMIPAKKERKLDIYNNKQGELCIIFAFRGGKWYIRVPLIYKVWDYIRENYPMNESKQGRKNKVLWRVLAENKRKIDELDKERKEEFGI